MSVQWVRSKPRCSLSVSPPNDESNRGVFSSRVPESERRTIQPRTERALRDGRLSGVGTGRQQRHVCDKGARRKVWLAFVFFRSLACREDIEAESPFFSEKAEMCEAHTTTNAIPLWWLVDSSCEMLVELQLPMTPGRRNKT